MQSIQQTDDLSAYRDSDVYQNFDVQWLTAHKPDRHYTLIEDKLGPIARCSIWWTDVPRVANETLGVIGHYAAQNATASQALLDQVCEVLQQQSCSLAVGPMNGNTWRQYRFITERGEEPSFFLEPDNPKDWPEYWLNAGFTPLSTYRSGLVTDLTRRDNRLARMTERMQDQKIELRTLDMANFQQELQDIYAVCVAGFKRNYLYTPIDEGEFIQQYSLIRPLLNPALTLVAEKDGQPVGFLFALSDVNEQKRGEAIQTVILKTVAVLPGSRQAGLGAFMVDAIQQQVRAMGMTRVIHALMHDSNHSRNISHHYAAVMRRYTLFSRRLNSC